MLRVMKYSAGESAEAGEGGGGGTEVLRAGGSSSFRVGGVGGGRDETHTMMVHLLERRWRRLISGCQEMRSEAHPRGDEERAQ